MAVATLTPLKAFGASSYGPLKYRVNCQGRRERLAAPRDACSPARAQGARVSRDTRGRVQAVGLRFVLDRFRRGVRGLHQAGERAGGISRRLAPGAASEQRHPVFETARRSGGRQSDATRGASASARGAGCGPLRSSPGGARRTRAGASGGGGQFRFGAGLLRLAPGLSRSTRSAGGPRGSPARPCCRRRRRPATHHACPPRRPPDVRTHCRAHPGIP